MFTFYHGISLLNPYLGHFSKLVQSTLTNQILLRPLLTWAKSTVNQCLGRVSLCFCHALIYKHMFWAVEQKSNLSNIYVVCMPCFFYIPRHSMYGHVWYLFSYMTLTWASFCSSKILKGGIKTFEPALDHPVTQDQIVCFGGQTDTWRFLEFCCYVFGVMWFVWVVSEKGRILRLQ